MKRPILFWVILFILGEVFSRIISSGVVSIIGSVLLLVCVIWKLSVFHILHHMHLQLILKVMDFYFLLFLEENIELIILQLNVKKGKIRFL